MAKELIVAVGDYGSGKTAFTKWYAKNNKALYCDYDLIRYGGDFEKFIKRLESVVQDAKQETIVLDGWGDYPPRFKRLEELGDYDIKLCLCFAAPHIIENRQKRKNKKIINASLPHSQEVIIQAQQELYRLISTAPYEAMFVDTSEEFEFVPQASLLQRFAERAFVSKLDEMPHDKYYQDIELPSGVKVSGYSKSHQTWERLQNVLDYRGKKILDIGCFHGYFSFKTEEAGAARITGVDANEWAVKVAKEIAYLKHSKADFIQSSAEDYLTSETYDIIFILNMLHHVKDIERALSNVFQMGKAVIFEIPTDQRLMVDKAAKEHGHDTLAVMNSHRLGRLFVVYGREKESLGISKPAASKYHYNYRLEEAKIKILLPLARFPLASKVRKLLNAYFARH